ncbi:MAG: hypothetical protein JO016_01885 [Actinobacteria bacterium]|nr:hypothetical protein [Actinomycetota bacterium]
MTAAVVVLAIACLAAAITAAAQAHAKLIRKPTPAELSAAAAAGVASRWAREPAGQIFPATLPYYSDLRDRESAGRAGISPAGSCAAALDAAVATIARRDGCQTVLRASYADQLNGVVYTIGVLAFSSAAQAAAFLAHYQPGQSPVRGLRAAPFPGTAAASFNDAARQVALSRQDGPYAVLTVAGYADGAPAAATGQPRSTPFYAAGELAEDVGTPLGQPVTVTCERPEWSC